MAKTKSEKTSVKGASNVIAMVAYFVEILSIIGIVLFIVLFIIGIVLSIIGIAINVIILLASDKRDKYLRFHVIQSILFAVTTWFIAVILFFSIIGILLFVPFAIIILILWIVLVYKALVGQKFKLPVIGDYAERHA